MLGREPAMPGTLIQRSHARLRDRTVLITGAGGSIGADLAREVARAGPRRLLLLDRSEPDLVAVCRDLASLSPPPLPILGDICDAALLDEVFRRCAHRGDAWVLHAAALKHVAFLETQPLEAIRVNVLGTRALLAASRDAGVAGVVVMSTDKAVAPVSLLGASKRATERMVQAAGPGPTCIAVRSGNVRGSRGSALPLFDAQIRRGGPVTVTDAGATRYFATPEQAVGLVLAATWLGEPGDVLVPDLGAPISILSLARERIARSGRRVGIRLIGLRPGERRAERLADDDEPLEPTASAWVRRVKGLRPLTSGVESTLDRVAACVARRDAAGAVAALHQLVPEWAPSDALLAAVAATPETTS
jgi:FlaA1/EpsC-like NDP-sugar epimerase